MLLRGARPPAPAQRLARARELRPLGPAHDGGHAAAQALLPGHREAAAPAHHDLPEVLPHDRHRERRHHDAASDLLRDARQLLDRRSTSSRARSSTRGSCRSTGFGFKPEDIWITVYEGDDALGLGPDEEAIAVWEAIGVPRSRIVLLPSEENFWQAGPTGPCGPCSELYLDRGLEWGTADDLPGGENERFLEYWNLVFMQYDQDPVGTLTPLPAKNIDTGLGLNRMALIQQGVDSIFETDQFAPLMTLGRELATSEPDERALRILADHTRGDDVPHRRRRRALQRGPRLRPAPDHAPRAAAGPPHRHRARLPAAVRRASSST